MLMTGCKKEPTPTPDPDPTVVEPTLTLVEGEGYLAEGDEINVGEMVKAGFVATGENLVDLSVIVRCGNDTVFESILPCEGLSQTTKETSFILDQAGDLTLSAVLTDGNAHTASLSLNFKGINVEPPVNDEVEGTYEGFIKIEGSIAALGISYPVNDSTQARMAITLAEDNRVTAVLDYQGTSYEISGSTANNSIVFDDFPLEISNSEVQLSATIQLNGTVEDDVLTLDGTLTDCSLNFNGIPIPVIFTGGISGILAKITD